MARGKRRVGNKRKTRNKVRTERRGSDESDEDYEVTEDEEFDESEDEYCSSLCEDYSDESFGSFEEEEEEDEEWAKEKIKKVGRPRVRKSFLRGRRKNGFVKPRKKEVAYNKGGDCSKDGFSGLKPRNKRRNSHREDEDFRDPICSQQEDDLDDEKPSKRSRGSRREFYENGHIQKPRKKNEVSYLEEEGEDDCNDFYDDDDEEFRPDDVDVTDDEEESPVINKNKVGRPRILETQITRRKRTRKSKTLKRTKRKKPDKGQALRRTSRFDVVYGLRDESLSQKKKTSERGRQRRKPGSNSDADSLNSASSDHEYTVSEEEREQIREGHEFCKTLTASPRISSSLKTTTVEETLLLQQKHSGIKGKEKVEDIKIEVGKQVCGICLSEEGKRTIRGILNCCSHYFCFACIMEWSKVESRCPLCKQRFGTISRMARADGTHDLRNVVISVPERDQVYQPSEEELRDYLDPYENFFCTECHEGGDDALMLLCDLCDSPAHTYCVGLGREVPDGNWYCDGCRPTALASTNTQAPNPTPDSGANNSLSVASSPAATVRETFDLNEIYVPDTPLTQTTGHSPSPRPYYGDQAAFSAFGYGASTVSQRRQMHRQMQQIRSRTRHWDVTDTRAPVLGISLFGSRIDRDVTAPPQTVTPMVMTPHNIFHQGRSANHSGEVRPSRLINFRGQARHNQASTSTEPPDIGLSHNDYARTNARFAAGLGHQQLHPCSGRSDTGPDPSLLPCQFRETTVPSSQLQGPLRTPF